MGEVAITVFKWILKASIAMAVAVTFSILIVTVISMIGVVLNGSILGDLIGIIQIWLPFNISVLLAWLSGTAMVYIGYRISLLVLGFISSIVD